MKSMHEERLDSRQDDSRHQEQEEIPLSIAFK